MCFHHPYKKVLKSRWWGLVERVSFTMRAHLLEVCTTVAFVAMNIGITIYIKWVFHTLCLPIPFLLVGTQQLIAFLSMVSILPRERYTSLDHQTKLKAAFLGAAFGLQVLLNNVSLVSISLTVNQTIRAFSPCVVVLLALCVEQKVYPFSMWVCCVFLTSGIVMTGWKNPSFEFWGTLLVGVSTLLGGAYDSLCGKLLGSDHGIPTTVLIFYQSLVVSVLLLPLVWSYESSMILTAWHERWEVLVGVLLGSGVLALVYNWIKFKLIQRTDSLFVPMVTNFKVVLLVIFDVMVFGERLGVVNVCGVILTFASFVVHTWLRSRHSPSSAPPTTESVNVELQPLTDPPMLP